MITISTIIWHLLCADTGMFKCMILFNPPKSPMDGHSYASAIEAQEGMAPVPSHRAGEWLNPDLRLRFVRWSWLLPRCVAAGPRGSIMS